MVFTLLHHRDETALPYRFGNKPSAIDPTPLLDHAPTACDKDPRNIVLSRSCQHRKRNLANKSELLEAIAKHAGLSKASAGRALEAALSAIKGSLKKKQRVSLVGFGTFNVGHRAARIERNPRTGNALKDFVN